MANATLRKKIQKKFKIIGYTIKVDTLEEIIFFVNQFQDAEDEAIDLLLDELQSRYGKSSLLDKEPVKHVISKLLKADEAIGDSSQSTGPGLSFIQIIHAFNVPKFRYNHIKKQFYMVPDYQLIPIHGDASAKAALYEDRFLLLHQRVSRDQHFSRPAFESDMSHYGSCEIAPIQSLIGQTGRTWIMGLISQLEDGHFYLEDLTASVEIDLSEAKITTGFISENTIVVAEGEMLLNGIFQVLTCGFPPLEDKDMSRRLLTGLDFFGSGTMTKEENLRLMELEKNAFSELFVIISDIWLDNEEVMQKLKSIFDGFEAKEAVPSMFILMGNFCSHPCNLAFSSFSDIRSWFGKLGELIEAHPNIKERSKFILVPGPDDAGPSTVLPRCGLSNYLTEEFLSLVPNTILSSNPCRIKFYTQEIVCFRRDLLHRMRRLCLMPPSTEETDAPFEHLVATITHQSHLCPLPLMVQPIIWNYDHSLHLYPLPDVIALGDRSEQKAFKYTGTTCFNTGSFSIDGTFVVYRPFSREVELSAV